MISPFGGSANRAATSRGRPAHDLLERASSARGTRRPGAPAAAAASDAQRAGSRRGDSNATAGVRPRLPARPTARRAPRAARQVAEELVALAGEAARRRAPSSTADGARQDRHREPGVERRRDEPHARVVDPGSPASLTSATRSPAREPRRAPRPARGLVVPVVAEQRPRARCRAGRAGRAVCRVSSQSTTSASRSSREHAQRDVVEVPDRRRADRERHARASRSLEGDQAGADDPGLRAELAPGRSRTVVAPGVQRLAPRRPRAQGRG